MPEIIRQVFMIPFSAGIYNTNHYALRPVFSLANIPRLFCMDLRMDSVEAFDDQ